MTNKNCFKCSLLKSLEEYPKLTRSKDGRTGVCKACTNARGREWRKRNPDRHKQYIIARRYGLSPEEYALFVADGCYICGSLNRLVVDHDHACCPTDVSCGKCVRKALCYRCNNLMGWVDDSVELLQKYIDYIHEHTERRDG